MIGQREDAKGGNSGNAGDIISLSCRHLKRLFIRQKKQDSTNHFIILRIVRPVALPAALLVTLSPTLPFLIALASPMSRAIVYNVFRNPIALSPFSMSYYFQLPNHQPSLPSGVLQ